MRAVSPAKKPMPVREIAAHAAPMPSACACWYAAIVHGTCESGPATHAHTHAARRSRGTRVASGAAAPSGGSSAARILADRKNKQPAYGTSRAATISMPCGTSSEIQPSAAAVAISERPRLWPTPCARVIRPSTCEPTSTAAAGPDAHADTRWRDSSPRRPPSVRSTTPVAQSSTTIIGKKAR